MYIRFVVHRKDEDSGRRMGLFQAFFDLRDAGLVSQYEEDQLLQIRDWFDANLEKPGTFSRSNKFHAKSVAISWFKDTATEHIARMYELKTIVETHGIVVDVIRTDRPGYIVYEDIYQVTAEPYAETNT